MINQGCCAALVVALGGVVSCAGASGSSSLDASRKAGDVGPGDLAAREAGSRLGVDAGLRGPDDSGLASVRSGQFPIQVILNVHNHSMAAGLRGSVVTDVSRLHCMVRSWLAAADGWLRLPTLPEPMALSGLKFSLMLEGHWTAWNTYNLAHQVAGGDFCTTPRDYVSPFILDTDATGAAVASAALDLGALVTAGHEVGMHTHCHEMVEGDIPDGYPPELFWTDVRGGLCDGDAETGDRVHSQVHEQIVKALEGTGYAPQSVHQVMGTVDWRLANGYKNLDAGFDALRLRNVAHPLWNPYRSCCIHTVDGVERCTIDESEYPELMEAGSRADCDPAAASLVGIPELAQAGVTSHAQTPTADTELFYERVAANPTFKYGTNNELPQMKKYFWMIYHERRLWELLGLPPRVWVLGFATHDSRVTYAQRRYDAGYYGGVFHEYGTEADISHEAVITQFYSWVAANFVGADADIAPAAEFATFDDVQDRFELWEASSSGVPSVGQRGYEGAHGTYPYELAWNRLIGPGNIWLSSTTRDATVYDVHDPAVYDMTPCGTDGVPYTYEGRQAEGAVSRLPQCSMVGDVVDRFLAVWSEEPGRTTVHDARAQCGSFAACEDPYVPVLAHDQSDVGDATFERASSVARGAFPRLVMCAAACCGSASACGDAGWQP